MRLLQQPSRTLSRWDELLRSRRLSGVCAVDAHGWPPYHLMMGSLQMYAVVGRPRSGDARADGEALMNALASGQSFCGVELIAAAGGFRFSGTAGANEVLMGGEARLELQPVLHLDLAYASLPRDARAVLICDGSEVHLREMPVRYGHRYAYHPSRPGACRAEVRVDAGRGRVLPWILSNPIYVR